MSIGLYNITTTFKFEMVFYNIHETEQLDICIGVFKPQFSVFPLPELFKEIFKNLLSDLSF